MSTTTVNEIVEPTVKVTRARKKVDEPTEATIEENAPETTSEEVKSEVVLIYVGPTTKLLTRYASFVGGLPTHMDEHFEKCKVLKKLFIDTKDFGEFEQSLLDASSVEATLFNKVQEYFSEVK